jgi:hypothetical protein
MSQTLPCSDPSSVPVDTFTVSTTLSSAFQGLTRGYGGGIWEVVVEATPDGQTNYIISLPSISFTGDASAVDGMTASEFFDLLARASVAEAVALGKVPCPGSCEKPAIVKITQPACVRRVGSGSETQFLPCDDGCCTREFAVCCPDGPDSPQITLVSSSSTGSSCAESCESTCPDISQLSLREATDARP